MTVRILQGDCRDVLKTLEDQSVHCVVTSPPYWGLRDYGALDQIGLEPTPQAFVDSLVLVFEEVRRVLRNDGTLWLNLGDSYARAQETNVPQTRNQAHGYPVHAKAGSSDGAVGRAERPGGRLAAMGLKPKDRAGVPWRVALALQEAGWWLRQDIIWSKPNPMPESVKDRCTNAHEYIFLMAKSERYYFDSAAIEEDAVAGFNGSSFTSEYDQATKAELGAGPREDNGKRNKRSVWTVTTQALRDAHFATFPPALIEPCILAGCPEGGTVLDPFGGAGTTGLVADRHHRSAILIELNPDYAALARRRIIGDAPLFAEVA